MRAPHQMGGIEEHIGELEMAQRPGPEGADSASSAIERAECPGGASDCAQKGLERAYEVLTIHPARHFWAFQAIETAIFVALAIGLLVASMYWIRRRIASSTRHSGLDARMRRRQRRRAPPRREPCVPGAELVGQQPFLRQERRPGCAHGRACACASRMRVRSSSRSSAVSTRRRVKSDPSRTSACSPDGSSWKWRNAFDRT
jgi:hypothetical protein